VCILSIIISFFCSFFSLYLSIYLSICLSINFLFSAFNFNLFCNFSKTGLWTELRSFWSLGFAKVDSPMPRRSALQMQSHLHMHGYICSDSRSWTATDFSSTACFSAFRRCLNFCVKFLWHSWNRATRISY